MKKAVEVLRPFVGDFIITTEEFKVPNEKGSLISKPDLYGIIVQRLKEGQKIKYGVRFGDGLEWGNNLNGLLSNPTGCYLTETEFYLDN